MISVDNTTEGHIHSLLVSPCYAQNSPFLTSNAVAFVISGSQQSSHQAHSMCIVSNAFMQLCRLRVCVCADALMSIVRCDTNCLPHLPGKSPMCGPPCISYHAL